MKFVLECRETQTLKPINGNYRYVDFSDSVIADVGLVG